MTVTIPTGDYGEPLPLVWDHPLMPLPAVLPALPTPADDRATLTARPVVTEADALAMGAIRDEQRHGFSRDNNRITEDQQRAWWGRMRRRVNAWLFYDARGALVAYGALIQEPSGQWVSSAAVLPEYAGRSFGKRVLSYLVNAVPHEVYAQALKSNPAAVSMHNALEWEVVREDHELVYFRTRPKFRLDLGLVTEDYA